MDQVVSEISYPFEALETFGTLQELAPGIFWMRLPLPMALNHVNIFVLDDEDGWTIVDTGFGSAKTKEMWREVLAGPLSGKPVSRIVVTHHHPDHIGLAGWFQTEFGAELVTTRTAWLMARMLVLDEQDRPVETQVRFWKRAGVDRALLAKRLEERPFNFADAVAPLPLGFTRIKDGDEITMGGRNWRVLSGNGHAPEQATFWCLDEDLVLGADQLLPSISPNLGVYPTEPMADPVSEWLTSCSRFLEHARDDQLVLPGHKLPFRGLPFRLEQLIDNHHGALARLSDFLETPHSAAECFAPLFKRKIGEVEYGLALVEAVAHVNHLHLKGLIAIDHIEDDTVFWKRTG